MESRQHFLIHNDIHENQENKTYLMEYRKLYMSSCELAPALKTYHPADLFE